MTVNRLKGADGLRAFACLLVVFHHISHRSGELGVGPEPGWLVPFVSNGGFGVVIFFVLSGFLLGRPFWVALEAGDALPSLRTYFLRRFARIAPGFLLALTLSLALALAVGESQPSGETALRFALGATFLSAFWADSILPVEVNGPLWSISYEVWSYILMPAGFIAVFALRKAGASFAVQALGWIGVTIAAIALHVLYLRVIPIPEMPDFAVDGFNLRLLGHMWARWFSIFGMFAIFAVGVLAAGIQVRAARHPGWWADVVAALCLAAALWIIFDFGRPGDPSATMEGIFGLPYNRYPLLPALVGGFLATAPSSRWLGTLIDLKPMRYLATISFGIYIYHMPILNLIGNALFGYDGFARSGADIAVFTALLLALTILVAHLSWHYLEKPVIDRARRLEKRAPREGAAKQAF